MNYDYSARWARPVRVWAESNDTLCFLMRARISNKCSSECYWETKATFTYDSAALPAHIDGFSHISADTVSSHTSDRCVKQLIISARVN